MEGKLITKDNISQIMEIFEYKLNLYRAKLSETYTSVYWSGLVKNTEEYIEELKERYDELREND